MNLVCTNNYRILRYDDHQIFKELTVGKIYRLVNEGPEFYTIIDDFGDEKTFIRERFITLKELRKNKLNELNEESE